ncbi:MAG TPA: hypothetical protein PKB14_16005 [Rubrivivax sp.]|nr:hypothetical protein [Rubrivivax sp.]
MQPFTEPPRTAALRERLLRLADGPDEVHRQALAKLELLRLGLRRKPVNAPVTRGG